MSQRVAKEVDTETFVAATVVPKEPTYKVCHVLDTVGYHEVDQQFDGTAMVQYQPTSDYASQDSSLLDRNRPLSLHTKSPVMNIAHLLAADE